MCGDKGGGRGGGGGALGIAEILLPTLGNHIIYVGKLTKNDSSYTVEMTSATPMNPIYWI